MLLLAFPTFLNLFFFSFHFQQIFFRANKPGVILIIMMKLTIRHKLCMILMEIIMKTFQISCIVSMKTSTTNQTTSTKKSYELEEDDGKKHYQESNRNHYYVNQNLWTQLVKFCCLQQWRRRWRRRHHDTQWISEKDMTADWTA